MGHRALVAYERAGDRYDLHYAHWGATDWQLATTITAESPYGHHDTEHPEQTGIVDPEPLATDCAFETVLDTHLDFQQYEAFYRVTETFEIEPSLVCWFGLPSRDTWRPGDGALLGVDTADPVTDGAHLRGWFTGSKETVCELVGRGRLGPDRARELLASAVHSWRSDGRTVQFGPEATRPDTS